MGHSCDKEKHKELLLSKEDRILDLGNKFVIRPLAHKDRVIHLPLAIEENITHVSCKRLSETGILFC